MKRLLQRALLVAALAHAAACERVDREESAELRAIRAWAINTCKQDDLLLRCSYGGLQATYDPVWRQTVLDACPAANAFRSLERLREPRSPNDWRSCRTYLDYGCVANSANWHFTCAGADLCGAVQEYDCWDDPEDDE